MNKTKIMCAYVEYIFPEICISCITLSAGIVLIIVLIIANIVFVEYEE